MLIAIDTQRAAEILASFIDGRRECESCGDKENAREWQDRFDKAAYFLSKLGIDVYLNEDDDVVSVCTEDLHLMR